MLLFTCADLAHDFLFSGVVVMSNDDLLAECLCLRAENDYFRNVLTIIAGASVDDFGSLDSMVSFFQELASDYIFDNPPRHSPMCSLFIVH